MKRIYRSFRMVTVLLYFVSLTLGYSATSYLVAPSQTVTINEHGSCRKVTNTGPLTIFVPTRLAGEWNSFQSNSPSNGVLSSCATMLVYGNHTSTDCTAGGGIVVADGASNQFCKFNSASCPGGWTKFQNWSTTTSGYCHNDNSCVYCHADYCDTSQHAWGNIVTETCEYEYPAGYMSLCYANISSIGCY